MRHGDLTPIVLAGAFVFSAGCGPEDSGSLAVGSVSPNARLEIATMLRDDLAAERHPADGGGRAWIEEGPLEVPAGSRQRWRLIYEAGPLGIAEGGMLFFQAPPFWGWSTPQTVSPGFDGYTTISVSSPDVHLEPENFGQQLLGIRVGGRALLAGERVTLDYGAGPARARADRYAESESRFWFAVDGDGDGIRRLIADPPQIAITAGPPERLHLTLTSSAAPGDSVRLTLAVLDAAGNAGTDFTGEIRIRLDGPAGLTLPRSLRLDAGDRGRREVRLRPTSEGVFRVTADGGGRLTATSNPLRVARDQQTILWADLHGHSGLTDGTGSPADYLTYAREIAALDVVALTDHDHWGLRPLSRHDELWEEIRRETERFHRPGVFVTLLGYEWTSWIHGHRHVLYFDDRGEVLSAVDPAYESPDALWAALRGQPALTFAHHSAGQPVATNWDYPPDPELEPVTEITSVHGSSEAADSPRPVAGAIAGNFVRDALDRGYRLGFIGSGDSHDGHPGLAHLGSPNGGLAALVGAEPTRESVLETLRARRVYATNGPRILLEVSFDGAPVGSTLPAVASGELRVWAAGTAAIERVDVVRSGQVVESVPGGRLETEVVREIGGLRGGEYLYVRVVQIDGGAAWSSPFFFE